jgi:hypothetical protein|tara:strand:- start:2740 stop:3342 length:603 start_codon:yes stop_codon:yes gene_type:complete
MALRTVGTGASLPIKVGVAQTSSFFTVQSGYMRVVAKGSGAHVTIGTDASAAITDLYIHAGPEGETLSMTKASQRVVGISTGTTTVLTAPEGTHMPFVPGDIVTVEFGSNASVDTNYSAKLTGGVSVLSVDNNIPNVISDNFARSNITVAADTSGIITAFNSAADSTVRKVLKLSCIAATGEGAANSVFHFQQVQTTGSA